MRLGLTTALLLFGIAVGCSAQPVIDPKVVDLRDLPPLTAITPTLAEKRVVFVGEAHDQYAHHLTQLAIIQAMHARHPNLAIGLEFFQQPFQEALDAYIAGEIDEKTMLQRTEYFDRWQYDYRLYRPILRYAREQGIPLVALNVPAELTRAIARNGLAGLGEEERNQLPAMPDPGAAYRERLHAIFSAHPQSEHSDFENFVQAQLLWDEGMAERAADYLRANPERPMVILAGSGHVAYGVGIPERLQRRLDVSMAVVVNQPQEELTPNLADFVLLPEPQPLPPTGQLGVFMANSPTGVRVEDLVDDGPAAAAGLQKGDRIVAIAGETIDSPKDVRLVMLNREAGQKVEVTVLRERWLNADERIDYSVILQ